MGEALITRRGGDAGGGADNIVYHHCTDWRNSAGTKPSVAAGETYECTCTLYRTSSSSSTSLLSIDQSIEWACFMFGSYTTKPNSSNSYAVILEVDKPKTVTLEEFGGITCTYTLSKGESDWQLVMVYENTSSSSQSVYRQPTTVIYGCKEV